MMPEPAHDLLILEDDGVVARGQPVDVLASGTTQRLCEILGPVLQTTTAGVRGSGRTAHWLGSGTVVVSDDARNDALLQLYICYDELDSSPYPDRMAKVSVFHGVVHCGAHTFSGGETEDLLLRIAGIQGYAGMLALKQDRLQVGFDLRKRRDGSGKRIGPRRLVQIVAEWGLPRGFARKAGADDMWSD